MLNARSIVNKIIDLKCYVYENHPELIMITESWATEDIDSELELDGYKPERFDRKDGRRGGGVLLYFKNGIVYNREYDLESDNIEALWCRLGNRFIGVCYDSTSNSAEESAALNSRIKSVCQAKGDVLICGDFNHPSIDWKNLDAGKNDMEFLDLTQDLFLTQHVTEPTRENNVLDLVLSSNPDIVQDVKIVNPLTGTCDHNVVEFNMICDAKQKCWKMKYFDYRKANWVKLKEYLSNSARLELNEGDVDSKRDTLADVINQGILQFVPIRVKKCFGPHRPLWWNGNIQRVRKRRIKWWNRYKESHLNHDFQKYKNAEREASRLIRNAKRKLEKKIANNIKVDTKYFWKYARSLTKVKSTIGPLTDSKGDVITDDQKTADEFNNFFSSVFTKETTDNIPEPKKMFMEEEDKFLKNVDITVEKVFNKLVKLNPNKAADVCGFNPAVFKECAAELAKPVTVLFKESLSTGCVPKMWKYANVTPIFKKGQRNLPSNYRPVSLTSILCRVLESLLVDEIRAHLTKYKLILETQHGFMPKKSCLSNLLLYLEDVTNLVDQGLPVDIIYLDFSKAFDSVPHQRLLAKLTAHGIGGHVLRWIGDWLNGRKQRVVVNGCASTWKDVTSGVPQGSILGPLLFIVFINDIDYNIVSTLSKFADDTKAYRSVENTERAFTLQDDLHKLFAWSQDWQMLFNSSKCKCLHVGFNNQQYDYFLGDEPIETTRLEKDLGVQISEDLKSENHISYIVKKANRISGCIKRTYTDKSRRNMIYLYKTLVRPLLEYCQQAWSPVYKKDIQKVEKVQRRFTKMINGLKTLPYEERLKKCNLLSLEKRRARADLLETFKIHSGETDVDPKALFTHYNNSKTRGHAKKIFKKHTHLVIRKNFYSQRIISPWNKLEEECIAATNINNFKSKIKPLFY